MSIYFQGKRISRMGALTEPSTYDADLTPVDMQNGKTAYVKGKKLTGTGRCFEKAGYGQAELLPIFDESGNEKYGISVFVRAKPNLILVASTTKGDIVLQTSHVFELTENEAMPIGVNYSASGELKVFYDGMFLNIYLENIEDTETEILYFYGRDNQV